MKNRKTRIWAGICLAMLFGLSQTRAQQPVAGSGPGIGPICIYACGQDHSGFVIKSYQGKSKCLDYTPGIIGSPIFLNDCANSHVIMVEETKRRPP